MRGQPTEGRNCGKQGKPKNYLTKQRHYMRDWTRETDNGISLRTKLVILLSRWGKEKPPGQPSHLHLWIKHFVGFPITTRGLERKALHHHKWGFLEITTLHLTSLEATPEIRFESTPSTPTKRQHRAAWMHKGENSEEKFSGRSTVAVRDAITTLYHPSTLVIPTSDDCQPPGTVIVCRFIVLDKRPIVKSQGKREVLWRLIEQPSTEVVSVDVKKAVGNLQGARPC